jgi:hypothetical protein
MNAVRPPTRHNGLRELLVRAITRGVVDHHRTACARSLKLGQAGLKRVEREVGPAVVDDDRENGHLATAILTVSDFRGKAR